MKVLLTGIDGFVGSHAAEFLLGLGSVEVHGTILPGGPGKNIAHLTDRVVLHAADIVDRGTIAAIMRDIRPDRVIHLAGQAFVPTSLADPSGTYDVNVMGGVAVLEGARLLGAESGEAPAVLVVSTAEVYDRNVPPPIREESPLLPRSPYAVSKICLELIAQEYRRTAGLNVTIVRPYNHIGPRQSPAFASSNFARQFAMIAAGKAPRVIQVGNLEARRDFTDVRDVVRGYWAILDHPSEETIFNLCSEQSHTIQEIVDMLGEISGCRVELSPDDARTRPDDTQFIPMSSARLRAVTGWRPAIPFRRTLADLFASWSGEVPVS
jgi:GDP-4-dehydro-6-deoxy-D-mannose reductase